MPESSRATVAVFLSYAREDAAAARHLADALRTAGVEVWFNSIEPRGEAEIREQIRTCARFVPIISANTQARGEGHFRREWQLAADRTHRKDGDTTFILPVVIDDTPEATARMPEEFRRVPAARLPDGVPTASFIDLVKSTRATARPLGAAAKIAEHDSGPGQQAIQRRNLAIGALVAVILLAAGGGWYFKQHTRTRETPVIMVMDSTYADRVYDPATLKNGGSNADDIVDLLHDLPVTLVKETTSARWRREPAVVQVRPSLVIIQRSAFYTFPESRTEELYPLADNKLAAFMGYIALQCPQARFIVYAQQSWEVASVATKWRDDTVTRFPQLAGKIELWRVPLDRPTFRNAQTASALRTTVVQTLDLHGKAVTP